MNLFSLLKNWKNFNLSWTLIEPFVFNLIKKEVPKNITKLYENLAKNTQPLINSLERLKLKIKTTPNELDDYCFNQGLAAIDTFAHYLLGVTDNLRK